MQKPILTNGCLIWGIERGVWIERQYEIDKITLADNYENPEDMDATSQASIHIENKEVIGNTEYFANAIQEETGGDLFSVVVKNPYPNDYDKITDMGSEEQRKDARPELVTHVENMDQYDTVFVGFPKMEYGISLCI